jgi:hypothetical protein
MDRPFYPEDIQRLIDTGRIIEAAICSRSGEQSRHGDWWKGQSSLEEPLDGLVREIQSVGFPEAAADLDSIWPSLWLRPATAEEQKGSEKG